MSSLSLACVNMLLSSPNVQSLVAANVIGRGQTFPSGWVFDSRPHAVLEKESHKTLVVVSEDDTWQSPGAGRVTFPRLRVDVWATPTKNPATRAVVKFDAEALVHQVFDAIKPYLHIEHGTVPSSHVDPDSSFLGTPGEYRRWGTPEQVASGSAQRIISSEMLDGPTIQPSTEGGEGSVMGTSYFGVIL